MNLAPPVDLAATTCICWEGGLLRRRVPTLPLRGCWRLLPWPITSHVVSQHPIEKSRLVKTSSWELLLLCLSMVCRFCCNRLVLLLVKSNAIALLVISSLGMGNVEEGAKLRRILENAAGSPDASSESDWRIRREEGIGRDKRSVPEILETKLGPKLIIC